MLSTILIGFLLTIGSVSSLPPCDIDILRAKATTPAWSLAYLNLADFTYLGTTDAKVKAIKALPPLPTPECTLVGDVSWKILWGPTDQQLPNLMYIVEYNVGGEKVFVAPVIRGTDASSGDVVSQVVQDLDALFMVDWSKLEDNPNLSPGVCGKKEDPAPASNGAKIARGTCRGLVSLMSNLTSNGQTVPQFMRTYTKANPDVPIIVTGHSLGGCQTTAVSLYLRWQLGDVNDNVIVGAFPFAPSTAGDLAFADRWNGYLGETSLLWLNTLDAVPYGYENVSALYNLWVPVVPALSPTDKGLGSGIYAVNAYLTAYELNYTMPEPAIWLKGYLVTQAKNWTSQEVAQHFPDMYYRLICQQYVLAGPKNVLDYPFPGTPTSPSYANCAQGVAAIGVLPGQIKSSSTKVVAKTTTTKKVTSSSTKVAAKTTTTKKVTTTKVVPKPTTTTTKRKP